MILMKTYEKIGLIAITAKQLFNLFHITKIYKLAINQRKEVHIKIRNSVQIEQ